MRLLLDENLSPAIARALQRRDHDVITIVQETPPVKDTEVLRRARDGSRVLVTLDRDFARLVFRHGLPPPPGIIYLRHPGRPLVLAEVLVEFIQRHEDRIAGHLIVIMPGMIRSRPFDPEALY